MHKLLTPLLTVALLCLTACSNAIPLNQRTDAPKPDYNAQLAPGEYALRKITDPARMPDLRAAVADTSGLDAVLAKSLNYLSKASSQQFFPVSGISHDRTVESLRAFRELLAAGMSGERLAAELSRSFDAYESIGYDRRGSVLITGYYTPILDASPVRTERFQHPLYRLPENHIKDPVTGQTIGLRRPDGSVDRNYPDRAGLLSNGSLNGTELVWLADPFEAYVVSVQGSAILRMPDGSTTEVGYAGTNGHDYTAIGHQLVKDGKIAKDDLNLRAIRNFFRQNPTQLATYANLNKRFIFFQPVTGGPFGSLNEQVTATRSIATDKSIFPRGGLCIVEASLPTPNGGTAPLTRLVSDQDTGGAIRAPGRLDYFWGVGDSAEALAGRTMSQGRLIYLILNDAEYNRRRTTPDRVSR